MTEAEELLTKDILFSRPIGDLKILLVRKINREGFYWEVQIQNVLHKTMEKHPFADIESAKGCFNKIYINKIANELGTNGESVPFEGS